ncbi:MAG TPA: hypothetical protein PLU00_01830, partial [Candidatus Pacearchaeota archaeon]|nr:hypothetical protein [Candidatus Pacearchaeota archaeon]
MKQSKDNKKLNYFRFAFLGFFLPFLFLSLFYVFAENRAFPYNPGETLDPECKPGEANCTVVPMVPSTRKVNVSFPLTGGGELSNDISISLKGLSEITTEKANYIIGINSSAEALEYKKLEAGENVSISHESDGTIKISSTGGVSQHKLLSITHSDTDPGDVSQGALIVGQLTGGLIKWKILTIGDSGSFLKSNGTDVLWEKPLLTDLSDTNIATPLNNQLLKYDSTTSKWINFSPSYI